MAMPRAVRVRIWRVRRAFELRPRICGEGWTESGREGVVCGRGLVGMRFRRVLPGVKGRVSGRAFGRAFGKVQAAAWGSVAVRAQGHYAIYG